MMIIILRRERDGRAGERGERARDGDGARDINRCTGGRAGRAGGRGRTGRASDVAPCTRPAFSDRISFSFSSAPPLPPTRLTTAEISPRSLDRRRSSRSISPFARRTRITDSTPRRRSELAAGGTSVAAGT